MNSNVRKQAQKDAYEQAAAYMSYGEGAGTRRKLINETVDYKMERVPGYREAFIDASSSQDMVKHARNAKNSQRRKTVSNAVSRNTRAVVTGRYENANMALLVGGAAAIAMHHTGMDRALWRLAKRKARQVRAHFKKSEPKPGRPASSNDNVYLITNL